MKIHIVLLWVLGVCCAASAQPAASVNPAGYSYEVSKVRTASDVCLHLGSNQNKSTYSVEFSGDFKVVKDADVVAVEQSFVPLEAPGAKGNNLYNMNSRKSGAPRYTAVHTRVAQMGLPRTELLANAFLIDKMRVQAEVVIAKKREEKVFAVRGMEDFERVADGLSIRIRNINMSDKRELTVVVKYTRTEAGTRMPFLEAVYALDTQGKEIGGDRWASGDPFATTGELTYKFYLSGDQTHKSLRLVAVTDNAAETVAFDISGAFQK